MSRSFFSFFAARDPRIADFLALDCRDEGSRRFQTESASRRRLHPTLVEELRRQNARYRPSPKRTAYLDALGHGGAAVVVTGQQTGLFLGPLYTFYKAASAIAVAKTLEKETRVPCVPLFWLQTEDHDFDEIAGCHELDTDNQVRRFEVKPDAGVSRRTSVAHHNLGPDVRTAVGELSQAIGSLPCGPEVVAVIANHYRPGVRMADAFAATLATLFERQGLLLFDPRVPTVAELAGPIYRRAVEETEPICARLQDRCRALTDVGIQVQVPARDHCSLAFFHDQAPDGPRFRLEYQADDGTFGLAGAAGKKATADLLQCVREEPLRLSSSALLRPLIQDSLLPTAAYVGGPAEVGYFAQLGPLYDHFDLPQPMVVPRARLRCLDEKAERRLEQIDLRAEAFEGTPRDLELAVGRRLAAIDQRVTPPEALERHAAEVLGPLFERMRTVLTDADATLQRPVDRTADQTTAAIDRLISKYTRTLARRDAVLWSRVERLRNLIAPMGKPQERTLGWASLAARTGVDRFTDAVLEAVAGPFSTDIRQIRL